MIKKYFGSRSALLPMLFLGICFVSQPAAAEDCEVKIGAVGPMSGGASAWGLAAKAGAEYAAALANADGGLMVAGRKCKVVVRSFDSQYTAAGGAAAANYMASESIHAIAGPVGSPETTGWRPVAARNSIVSFNTSYMAGVIGPEFPLAFHALQAPVSWAPLLIKAAKDRFHFKSMVITAPNDQGGADSSKQLAKMYGDLGVTPNEEYYQRGTTNFAPIVARILTYHPETVEISSVPPADASIIVRQLLEAGYTGTIGSLGGVPAEPIIQGAGGIENLKAVYYLQTMAMDNPGVVQLLKGYEPLMKSPAPPNPLFPVFTVSAEQVLRAISIAGTDQDGEKIAVALRSMTPQSRFLGKLGWRGKTIYGINQELAFPVGLGLIIDGKKLPVQEVAIPSEP